MHDRRLTEWQKTLDQDHKMIYIQAVKRLEKIFEDKNRYIHCKAPRQQGKQTRQHKNDLAKQCTKPWQPSQHRWEPHRSGYHCSACRTRMHQGLTTPVLEARLKETCAQLQVDTTSQEPGPEAAPLTKKPTRAQKTKGYLNCTKCGTSIHKRINEAAFQEYVSSQCLDCAFPGEHGGHPYMAKRSQDPLHLVWSPATLG